MQAVAALEAGEGKAPAWGTKPRQEPGEAGDFFAVLAAVQLGAGFGPVVTTAGTAPAGGPNMPAAETRGAPVLLPPAFPGSMWCSGPVIMMPGFPARGQEQWAPGTGLSPGRLASEPALDLQLVSMGEQSGDAATFGAAEEAQATGSPQSEGAAGRPAAVEAVNLRQESSPGAALMTTGRENEAARGLVQAALPHLEQQLARHGLSCERLSVAVGSFDGGDAPHGVEVKQAAVTATHKGAAGQETFLGFVSLRESVPRAAGTGNGGVPARPEAGEAPGSGAGVAPLQESGRPNRSGLGDLPWGGEAGGREIGTPAVQQGAAEAGGTEAPRPVVLAREIVHQGLAVWQKGYGQVRLKLHPEALGEVRLEVTSRAGRIAAHLVVENEAARSLVQAALPHLQQQLADHGLTCERFSVEVGNFGGGGYERGSGSSGGFGKSTPGSGSSWATEGRGSGTKDQVFSLVEYWV